MFALRFSPFLILAASLFQAPKINPVLAEDESGAYLFLGVEVMAKTGRSHYPISSVKKKHVYVEIGDKVKRLPIRTPCVLRTEWVLTEHYAEVLETNHSVKLLNDQSELDAMAEMLRQERRNNMAAYDARNSGDRELAARIEERNEDYQSSTQNALDRGDFIKDGTADTIVIDTSILPLTDIKSAYAVACVTYDQEDLDTGESFGRGGSARARFIGDLTSGEIHQLKFNVVVETFKRQGAEILLYLYTKNGDPIALSNSSKLKRLTPEQTQQFRNLSG